jgi:exopolysaccharide biosynthesis polyprenyl glycosylphosphotransferase
MLGDWVATELQIALPKGLLGGSQYAIGLLMALLLTGNYGRGDNRRDARRLFTAAALATALPLWTTIWTNGFEVVALQFALTTVLVFAGLLPERLLIDRVVALVRPKQRTLAPTLFVGASNECQSAMADRSFREGSEYRTVGFVDVSQPTSEDAIGHVQDFEGIMHRTGAEVVVICGQLPDDVFRDIADSAMAAGCQVLLVPREVPVPNVHQVMHVQYGRPLIELQPDRLRGDQRLLKRVMDIVGASVVLILISPLLALVALAVALSSPGPILFFQERVGSGGRRFRLLKFRTMYRDADEGPHREYVKRLIQADAHAAETDGNGQQVFKLVDDKRITPVGRFLRASSLDELPQLLNVLRGEMSLVGPRPPLPYEVDEYDYWQFQRLQFRPGITGLWQVSGRNHLTYRQMCEIDLDYVRRWSLWLDVQILARTIPVVLRNSGGAR